MPYTICAWITIQKVWGSMLFYVILSAVPSLEQRIPVFLSLWPGLKFTHSKMTPWQLQKRPWPLALEVFLSALLPIKVIFLQDSVLVSDHSSTPSPSLS